MIALAYLLIIAGFIAAAFVASLDARQVDWLWFGLAIAVGVIGVVVLKVIKHKASRHGDLLESNREVLTGTLDRIVAGLEELSGKKEQIPTYEMRFEIDHRFRNDLNDFAEARMSMAHLYGLQRYANIMSHFAAGERYINRVWSASADGYQDEVLNYVDKALSQFREARERLSSAIESVTQSAKTAGQAT